MKRKDLAFGLKVAVGSPHDRLRPAYIIHPGPVVPVRKRMHYSHTSFDMDRAPIAALPESASHSTAKRAARYCCVAIWSYSGEWEPRIVALRKVVRVWADEEERRSRVRAGAEEEEAIQAEIRKLQSDLNRLLGEGAVKLDWLEYTHRVRLRIKATSISISPESALRVAGEAHFSDALITNRIHAAKTGGGSQ